MQFNPDALLSQLGALEEGIKTEVLRPAAEAAARVYRDDVIQRVPKRTGLLASAIYEAYSPERSEDGKSHTYHVSWNKRKAPHGHLIEFGTSRAPAHPFLRPAYYSAGEQAMAAARQVIAQRGQQVIDGIRS
ncbi:hypothetical protein FVQ98_14535 [Ottowia sp. GY511]|nr:hypothetical protein FVQ98_14535 [Ottowia sp. GY511]